MIIISPGLVWDKPSMSVLHLFRVFRDAGQRPISILCAIRDSQNNILLIQRGLQTQTFTSSKIEVYLTGIKSQKGLKLKEKERLWQVEMKLLFILLENMNICYYYFIQCFLFARYCSQCFKVYWILWITGCYFVNTPSISVLTDVNWYTERERALPKSLQLTSGRAGIYVQVVIL